MFTEYRRKSVVSGLNADQQDDTIFEVETVGDVVVLQVVSDPSVVNYVTRQHEYNELYKMFREQPEKNLIFDLTGCVMMDSVTIGIMVALTKLVRTNDAESILVGVSNEINEILGRLMLLQPDGKRAMWQSYMTRDDGIALLDASRH
jgi:anti-anti-sigma regulatory factor